MAKECGKFKLGDKVRSILHPEFGLGTVINDQYKSFAPILVKWKNVNRETAYTKDGYQEGVLRLELATKLHKVLS